MTLALLEPAIHPEGNAIFGYDGGNHFARNGRVRPKGVFVASAYNCEQNTEAYRDREQNGFL